MKCVECTDYLKCSKEHDLRMFRRHCKKAKEEKVVTNADRIRAMTDEELAAHLVDIGFDCHLCSEHRRLDNEPLLRNEKCDEKCEKHCLDWLKQPAEGDGDGNET